MSKLRVAVLMGGDSGEREVSLLSGKAVLAGLDKDKYDAVPVELSNIPSSSETLPEALTNGRIDLAFLALHGGGGEDGRLQSVLEGAGIRYTGSGPKASANAMNKIIAKQLFQKAEIRIPCDIAF